MDIKPILPGKSFLPRKSVQFTDLRGEYIANIYMVPKVIAGSIVSGMKKKECVDHDALKNVFKKAASIFLEEEIEGVSFDKYVDCVHRSVGIPIKYVFESARLLGNELNRIHEKIEYQMPKNTRFFSNNRHERNCIYWVPKGNVLSVSAPANNPLVHRSWLEVLASGYSVAVRPSNREPFTPFRLIKSLINAGLPEELIAFLPGEYDVVDELVSKSDYSLVFGDATTMNKYSTDRNMLLRGPGYSKVLWDDIESNDPVGIEKLIVNSIVSDGGMKCTNTSGIYYNAKNQEQMEALIDKLLRLKPGGFQDLDTDLPLISKINAVKITDYIKEMIKNEKVRRITGDNEDYFVEIEDGICAMYPLIMDLGNEESAITKNFEMPFPAFWIKKFDADCEMDVLKNSLSVIALTDNEGIKNQLILDTSVKKIMTSAMDDVNEDIVIPHDGFLLDNLFYAKAFL